MIDGRAEMAEDENGEIVWLKTEDTGAHGSRYRIRLKIAGAWRTVDWEKLGDERVDPGSLVFGKYFLAASWNGWATDDCELTRDPDVPGLFRVDQRLPISGGDFLLLRNDDWGQVLYPMPFGEEEEEIGNYWAVGPEDYTNLPESGWWLEGKEGDVFRIELQRFLDEDDFKRVSWRRLPDTSS